MSVCELLLVHILVLIEVAVYFMQFGLFRIHAHTVNDPFRSLTYDKPYIRIIVELQLLKLRKG